MLDSAVNVESADALAAVTPLLMYYLRSSHPAAAAHTPPVSADLALAWRSLQTQTGRLPTSGFEWCDAAARTLHASTDLSVISVTNGDRLDAVAPLATCTINSVPHLTFLSQNTVYEPMDLLYRDEQSLDLLLARLLRIGRPIYLHRLDAGSAILRRLRTVRLPLNLHRVTTHPGCPVIHLDGRWQTPENCLSSRRRQDLRRAQRKAAQFGRPRTEILAPTPAQLPSLLDTAWRIEALNWKGQAGSALQHDPIRGPFFRQLAHVAAEHGKLRLAFLYLGQTPAAMQLAIESNNSFWLLKIGYDRQFAACSPGQLLMRDSIAYAASRHLSTYEFLGSIAPWTEAWTQTHRDCVTLQVYPASVCGALSLSRKVATAVWNRIARRPRTVSVSTAAYSDTEAGSVR